MTKPTIRIHNTETNEVIDRDMTDAEIKDHELQNAKQEALEALSLEKNAHKLAVLEKLGLTAEEAAALLA
jgi:hypothetical protein